MTKITPRPPKGFRDFLPADMLKRNYVFGIITDTFHRFGFEPLQTPVVELSETLYGKYGEEAENLIFNVKHGRSDKDELSLRYDLTVPLARVVAQYESDLTFPFKRYQIAPVFRGERPQKGRYREFYQCDADIVGVASRSADAELVALKVMALKRLGFPHFTVKINHRQLLTAIGEFSGVPKDQLPDLYRSVDKFDKIGAEGVEKELVERGIDADVVRRMMQLITNQQVGTNNLDYLAEVLRDVPLAQQSIAELREMAIHLDAMGVSPEYYAFDLTMVRGLGYYTGPIFETVISEPNLGSISGGGRYDDLIGIFRKESLPTTGTSFGIERILVLMDELNLYPANIGGTVVDVLVTVMDENLRLESTRLASELREAGIHVELVMDDKKLGKQIAHADKKRIPLVAILGEDELKTSQVKIKHMASGEESLVARTDLIRYILTTIRSF